MKASSPPSASARIVGCVVLFVSLALSRAAGQVPIAVRERLKVGINVNIMLKHYNGGLTGWPLQDELPTYAEADAMVRSLKAKGFRHIRVVMAMYTEPTPHDPYPNLVKSKTEPDKLNQFVLDSLDNVIRAALNNEMAVILDPLHKWKEGTYSSPTVPLPKIDEPLFPKWEAFWTNFATQMSRYDPGWVYLELRNEPCCDAVKEDQRTLRFLKAARRGAPNHTILYTASLSASTGNDPHVWDNLLAIMDYASLTADKNVVYTFHEYAGGGDDRDYPNRWDYAKLDAYFGRAVNWMEKTGFFLHCGEFGDPSWGLTGGRSQYYKDVTGILNKHGLGWAAWFYKPGDELSMDMSPPQSLPVGSIGGVTVTPAGGTFYGPLDVGLSTAGNLSIRYTLDGSDPSASSPVYTTPVTISANTTLKARTFDGADGVDSVASAMFTFQPFTGPQIPLAETAPVIDGATDAVWTGAPAHALTKTIRGGGTLAEDDLSASAQLLWNASHLFLRVEVRDDSLYADAAGSYENDNVELFLDGDNIRTQTYGSNDFQFRFVYGTTVVTESRHGSAAGVQCRFEQTAGGYVLEAAVPWTLVGESPSMGAFVGLDVQVSDNDGTGRDAKLAWFAEADETWQNASLMETVQLAQTGGATLVTVPARRGSGGAAAGANGARSGAAHGRRVRARQQASLVYDLRGRRVGTVRPGLMLAVNEQGGRLVGMSPGRRKSRSSSRAETQ